MSRETKKMVWRSLPHSGVSLPPKLLIPRILEDLLMDPGSRVIIMGL